MAIQYSGPINITKGGTYTGNYKGDDNTPAVTISTYEPVELKDCNITYSAQVGIRAYGGTMLTVQHCTFKGYRPVGNNQIGRALDDYHPQYLVFENNEISNSGGVRIDHMDENTKYVYIRKNIFKNIDKRNNDGSPGQHMAAILFDGVVGIDGEIAWNYFENEVDKSWIEDNINLRNSGGTSGNWFKIHDNYIKGAYPAPFDYNEKSNTNFTGSGITIEGDPATTAFDKVAQYVHVYNNQVISTMNGGINVNHGHDHLVENNTIISSGMIPTGQYSRSFWGGGAIWNGSSLNSSVFFNIVYKNNTVGYYRKGVNIGGVDRQDWVIVPGSPISVDPTLNTSLPNPITLQTENAELAKWNAKLAANKIVIGPVTGPVVVGPDPTPVTDLKVKLGEIITGKITPLNAKGNPATFKAKTVKVISSSTTKVTVSVSTTDETTFTVTPKASGNSTVTISFTSIGGKTISKKYTMTIEAADDDNEAVDAVIEWTIK